MCICRASTLMAFRYHFLTDSLTQSIIEYKVFSFEFISQSQRLYIISIMNNATFQVENIFKPFMKKVCTGLLATDAASTIHNNILLLVFLKHLSRHWQLLAEGITRYFYSVFKMTN